MRRRSPAEGMMEEFRGKTDIKGGGDEMVLEEGGEGDRRHPICVGVDDLFSGRDLDNETTEERINT